MAAELATGYVSILPSTRGFGPALSRQIRGPAGQAGDDAGSESGKRFSGKFALAAKVGLAAAGAGLALFAKGAVSAASDVNESQSKVGVVFGKSSRQIVAASKTSAAAMGLSAGAYLEATGTLGNLLVSLKLAPSAAAGMSQQMVKLAGDLASFNNVSPEEALAAIKSGLVGETEPLRAFGVNMNDATLRAQALKLGLIKSVKDGLTPQAKALAAQALIMDQTKTAQGDFARTSGGLANQQRILAAQFQDVKAKVGAVLLPVFVKLANFASSKLLPAIGNVSSFLKTSLGPTLKTAKLGVLAFFAAMREGDVTSDGFVGVMERIGVVFKTNIIPAFQAVASFITTRVIPAIQAVVAFVVAHWPQISSAIVTAWNAIRPTLEAFGNLLKTIWVSVLQPIVAWVQAHWPQISAVIKVVFTAVAVAAGVLLAALRFLLNALAAEIRVLATVFRWLWNNVVTPVFNGIKATISGASTVIGGIIRGIGTTVHTIGGFFSDVYTDVQRVVGDILKFIGGIGASIKKIAVGIWSPLSTGLSAVVETIKALIQPIIDAIQLVIDAAQRAKDFLTGGAKTNFNTPNLDAYIKGAGAGSANSAEHRAMGGPVTAGHPYVVNERGIETFIPNVSGRIEPAGASPFGNGRMSIGGTLRLLDDGRAELVDAFLEVGTQLTYS